MNDERVEGHSSKWKRPVIIAAGIGLLALLAWGFLEGRKEAGIERERERPVKAPSRVSMQGDQVLVTLDSAALAHAEIRTAAIESASGEEPIPAYGTVLDIAKLTDLRVAYESAQRELQQAEASLEVSQRQYERARVLYADSQNVSAKVLDSAEAALRSDRASVQAASVGVRALAATARQDWGAVIAGWLASGSPAFSRLLEGQDVLVRLTFSPDVHLSSPPPVATLRPSQDHPVKAQLVSAAASTDPRIQGPSYFFVAPRADGLMPGMNIDGTVPSSRKIRGGVIPDSAVVWWQGKAWVYVATSPRTFARHEVPTEIRMGEGYLATDLPQNTQIVVAGAQALLSEELRSQIQVGED